jgi:hypothetical protein
MTAIDRCGIMERSTKSGPRRVNDRPHGTGNEVQVQNKPTHCRNCGVRVTKRNLGATGGAGTTSPYVRCKACTRKMIQGATSAGILDTRTGEVRRGDR